MFTFQRKPNQRPTTSELLEHPFIIDDAHSHSNSDHALSFSNPNGGGMDASSPGDGAGGGGEGAFAMALAASPPLSGSRESGVVSGGVGGVGGVAVCRTKFNLT